MNSNRGKVMDTFPNAKTPAQSSGGRAPAKAVKAKSMANTVVTGLSWYTKLMFFFFGVTMLMGGILVTTLPNDVTKIKASVTSVTWNGKDECGVTTTSSNKEGDSVVFHCNVVAKYKEDDADKEYEFYSKSGTRYNSGDHIYLYKFDGKVSQFNPNPFFKK